MLTYTQSIEKLNDLGKRMMTSVSAGVFVIYFKKCTTRCENAKMCYSIFAYQVYMVKIDGGNVVSASVIIKELRESIGMNRKEFSVHTGIPVRTLEDWEAGRRTPPEYIPRLIEYQLKYEKLVNDFSDDK